MKNLFNLLERFSQSLNKDAHTKETVVSVIKEKTRVDMDPQNISLKNGVLELSASSAAKNEIALKESLIRDILKERGVPVTRILYK